MSGVNMAAYVPNGAAFGSGDGFGDADTTGRCDTRNSLDPVTVRSNAQASRRSAGTHTAAHAALAVSMASRLGMAGLSGKPRGSKVAGGLVRPIVEQALLGLDAPAADERVRLLGIRELSAPTIPADEHLIRRAGRLADEALVGRRCCATRPSRLHVQPTAAQMHRSVRPLPHMTETWNSCSRTPQTTATAPCRCGNRLYILISLPQRSIMNRSGVRIPMWPSRLYLPPY